MSLKIECPGDVFAPRPGGLAEARKRADTADELANRRDGARWRPEARKVLVDSRTTDLTARVLLKTSVYGFEVVTERRHRGLATYYHVFEVGRMNETERTFPVEQGADALAYHATLEAAIRRRRQTGQEIRRLRQDGQTIGELLREYSAAEIVEALGVLSVADALGV